ncbi:uncharacterized vacuolar membrane protein [[Candida] railenensis]|uniref:Uncharacterized vacuolar membrane protein n=1 Tax=[Candida] railenensis TaxID=45579 RepID=A0A9P0W1A4_9ASCO|nr:uncharacterized vacuolar membrane protein [[Candida] railenensis]
MSYQSIPQDENNPLPSESVEGSDLESQSLLRSETGAGSAGHHDHHYVSPDDPIVSPLNLYKIQALRVVALVVFIINCILFFAFLFSDFIAIPGFDSRGKSFFELDLLILCGLSNLLTLWCFSVPAYYERILGYVIAILVGLDFVVALTVPYIRSQFGLMGIFIIIWTLLTFTFNSLVDYWVEQGKIYQEIKYTGREETRKTVTELFVVLIKTLVKFIILVLVWNVSFSLWVASYDSHVKPWGKMVAVNEDQFKIHLSCYGEVYGSPEKSSAPKDPKDPKQPIVLVEGGQLTSSEEFQEWIEELFHLNKIERYCIWDRPGYGFSDSAPSPTSISIITEYLMEALRKEDIEGPFSLVGFDIGGLYSRLFASRNPGKIHSLLLVDSWHEDLLKKDPFSGTNKKNEPKKVFKNILETMNTFTGFKLWLKGILSPLGVTQNLHWMFHPRKYSSNSRIFGTDMYWSSKYIRARLQEQTTSSILSYNEIQGSDIHNVPLSVISSDFMIKNSLNWGKWQRELTKLSDQSIEWVVAENSDHFIWRSAKGRTQLQQLLLRLVSEKSNY